MKKSPETLLTEAQLEIAVLLRIIRQTAPQVSKNKSKPLVKWLSDTSKELSTIDSLVDPIQQPRTLFDPADPKVIGRIVAMALIAQPKIQLDNVPKFYGSGIYALYYKGDFKAYKAISGTEHPIYVGKADPKIPNAQTSREQGPQLWGRLSDHLKSIRAVNGIRPEQFTCRFLVVSSGWQTAAENHLIHFYKPIWNNEIKVCFGIGKHGDSAGTRKNLRSPWDTIHPGRKWALSAELQDQKSKESIQADITLHFKKNPPIKKNSKAIEDLLKKLTQSS